MTTSTKARTVTDVAMRSLYNQVVGLVFHAATDGDPLSAEQHLDDAIECIHAMRRVLREGKSVEATLGESANEVQP